MEATILNTLPENENVQDDHIFYVRDETSNPDKFATIETLRNALGDVVLENQIIDDTEIIDTNVNARKQVLRVKSNGGQVILPKQIFGDLSAYADGTVFELEGLDDVDTLVVNPGNGVFETFANGAYELKKGSIISFRLNKDQQLLKERFRNG